MISPARLDAMFRPRSVAVVGASQNPSFVSGIFKNLLRHSYQGSVSGVNPRYESILGAPCYPSVLDVPGPLDLVVIGVASRHVPTVLEQCEEKGVGVVVGGVFSSGVAATGAVPGAYYNYAPADEAVLQRVRAIQAVCARHGVPLPAAALQFPLGHPAVAAVIPGAVSAAQVADNLRHMQHPIPGDFWAELKAERLIREDAPTP